jgi:hypothetical protein
VIEPRSIPLVWNVSKSGGGVKGVKSSRLRDMVARETDRLLEEAGFELRRPLRIGCPLAAEKFIPYLETLPLDLKIVAVLASC